MQLTNIDELNDFLKSDKFDFHNFQILSSKIPSVCQNKSCILGVDEAGRGPVLGPMVYAVSFIPKEKACDLEEIGCADSKTLNEKKREDIFSILCSLEDYIGWAADVISPNYISNKMLKRVKYSLNEIAEEATLKLINLVIESKVNVSEIYVDTVGPPDKYQEKLSKIFPQCKVTVAKKADSTYPIVSAASICAKVIRDATLYNWKCSEKLSFKTELGSGYPNDPQTKTFLKENVDAVFGFPNLVRFSWSTATKVLEDCVTVECFKTSVHEILQTVDYFKYGLRDEESVSPTKKESITNFFRPSMEKSKHEMKHHFFKQRNLANINYF